MEYRYHIKISFRVPLGSFASGYVSWKKAAITYRIAWVYLNWSFILLIHTRKVNTKDRVRMEPRIIM